MTDGIIDWLHKQIDYDAQIALHDPARGLRQVVALRAVVEVCAADLDQRGGGALEGLVDRPTWDVLCHLASMYPHRDGYNPDWNTT